MHSIDDTIAAIASAAGGAARGIARISGPDAVPIVAKLFTPAKNDPDNPSSSAALADVRVPTMIRGSVGLSLADRHDEQPLPCDLYLWPTARSYTRQPVAELHTFGSPPLLEALLRHICLAGARPAEPGEFTLRAFLSGRIDLVQAEAVLGVIDAADRRQLDAALAQMAGGMSRPLALVRNQLLDLLADLEAGLDFVEEDIRFIDQADVMDRLTGAADVVARLTDQLRQRDRTDAAPRIVLVGAPNAGKSSLFNTLLGQRAALVSEQPGTTRDYLSARLDVGGILCELIDTAGVEAATTAEPLSNAAQQLSRERNERADLRLLCLDGSSSLDDGAWTQLEGNDSQIAIITKCDLPQAAGSRPANAIETSAATGQGLDELKSTIRRQLSDDRRPSAPSAGTVSTSVRCRDSLRLAAESLARARELATDRRGDELIAAEVRTALSEFGKIVGAIYTDDLLDRIFSRFCIGK